MAERGSLQGANPVSAKQAEVVSVQLISTATETATIAYSEESPPSTASLPIGDPPGSISSNMTDGYPRLAQEMGKIPERMILRRFGALNAQSLLYYQAELTQLEAEYRELERRNCAYELSTGRLMRSSTNWWTLAQWPGRTEEEKEQWDLFKEIRELLEKYSMQLFRELFFVVLSNIEENHLSNNVNGFPL